MRENARARTAAMAACCAVLAVEATAATPASRLADVEKRRQSALAERARLSAAAKASAGQVASLGERLVAAAASRAEAESRVEDATQRLASLMARESAAAHDARLARDGLERALIALARTEFRGDPQPNAAGPIAAALGHGQAGNFQRGAARAAEAARLGADVARERAALAEASAALDAERLRMQVLLAAHSARRDVLSEQAERAAQRADALGREARSLRELAERAAARQSRSARRGGTPFASRLLGGPAEMVSAFGARTSAGGQAKGLTMRTVARAQVLAPERGEVVYAGPFRSYGNVLILDLDRDYVIVLTGMKTLLAAPGDQVLAGQPVAEMGDSATTAPELYVEVRARGVPIDPSRFIAASMR